MKHQHLYIHVIDQIHLRIKIFKVIPSAWHRYIVRGSVLTHNIFTADNANKNKVSFLVAAAFAYKSYTTIKIKI